MSADDSALSSDSLHLYCVTLAHLQANAAAEKWAFTVPVPFMVMLGASMLAMQHATVGDGRRRAQPRSDRRLRRRGRAARPDAVERQEVWRAADARGGRRMWWWCNR